MKRLFSGMVLAGALVSATAASADLLLLHPNKAGSVFSGYRGSNFYLCLSKDAAAAFKKENNGLAVGADESSLIVITPDPESPVTDRNTTVMCIDDGK